VSWYIFAKMIHIVSMIFFIGVVGFRTFVIPVLKRRYDPATYREINALTGKRARSIIKINNLFLIASGVYLLSLHWGGSYPLLYLKVTIGLVLASTFYLVPYIMASQKHRPYLDAKFVRSVVRMRGIRRAAPYAEGFETLKVQLDGML